MNKQDVEDFRQDFLICMFLGKYTPSQVNSYRDFYVRSRDLANQVKNRRRDRLLIDYKIVTELSPPAFNEELFFSILERVSYLTNNQKRVILEFIKCGSLKEVARVLKKDYNTTKAHYLTGVRSLRELTKELL